MKLLVTIIGIGMIFGGVTDVFITLHIAKKMGGEYAKYATPNKKS